MGVKYQRPEPTPVFSSDTEKKSGLIKAGLRIYYKPDVFVEDFFYLNPNLWNDKKSGQWISQKIPGMSDPILHWAGSGSRTLTFEALVTKDLSIHSQIEKLESEAGKKQKLFETQQVVERRYAQLTESSSDEIQKEFEKVSVKEDSQTGYSLDITDKLDRYRTLVYPVDADAKGVSPPPLIQLFAGTALGRRSLANVYWAVQSVDIRITRQLNNLIPIEASVTFMLIEYVPVNLTTKEASKG